MYSTKYTLYYTFWLLARQHDKLVKKSDSYERILKVGLTRKYIFVVRRKERQGRAAATGETL